MDESQDKNNPMVSELPVVDAAELEKKLAIGASITSLKELKPLASVALTMLFLYARICHRYTSAK